MVADEVGGKWTQRTNCVLLGPHRRVSFDVGDGKRRPVEHIVGHRDDAAVHDEFVASPVQIVAHNELGGCGIWHIPSVP